ncbi:MAG: OmpA family protein [Prevotellaceae bacterium]|jgi:chemotaxis protein MotB|nr:OmpA family protein [Prevotellaceae bacterium]
MRKIVVLFSAAALVFTSACVSQKKYQDLEAQKAVADDKSAQLEEENANLRLSSKAQQERNQALNERVYRLQDTIQQLQFEQSQLSARYADLMSAQEAMQKGSQQEIRKLLEQLQANQNALQKKEDDLFATERALNERSIATAKLERDLKEHNKKMMALESALHQKDSVANALKQKLSDALLNFEGKGLTVKMRDGKVYVSMDEKLMFASGSFVVDKRGEEALRHITAVLEKNPDINVVIEGHTDDVPYIGAGVNSAIVDNWDLSCRRATSVVRLLLKGSTVEESRITAAGRAEYMPVKRAKTPEARQANRRIEIILTPKLDEVLKLLEQ